MDLVNDLKAILDRYDEDNKEKCFEDFAIKIRWLIFRLLRKHFDDEDTIEELYNVILFKIWNNFPPKNEGVVSWVIAITKNYIIDLHRKNKRDIVTCPMIEEYTLKKGSFEESFRNETTLFIEKYGDKLSPSEFKIFVSFLYINLEGIKEITDVFVRVSKFIGKSVDAVERSYYRGKSKINEIEGKC